MAELKPCPFCGGIAHLDFAHGSNQFYWGADGFEKRTPLLYTVFCASCGARTESAQDTGMAIMTWNRRTALGGDGDG